MTGPILVTFSIPVDDDGGYLGYLTAAPVAGGGFDCRAVFFIGAAGMTHLPAFAVLAQAWLQRVAAGDLTAATPDGNGVFCATASLTPLSTVPDTVPAEWSNV